MSLQLTVNGDVRLIPPGWTIADLLADLAIAPELVVVERNREIVRDRSTFSEVALEEGDVLELVHFVGGG